jgi:hypothetical protein
LDRSIIQVLLTDHGMMNYDQARLHFIDASIWALNNCKSFQGYEIVETADVSYEWDQIAEYRFTDPRDVTLFKLRWS